MATKLDRYINFIPKELNPASNQVLNALLRAWAGQDDEIMQQLINTKAQLFVKTAEGTFLDRLASNFGVARPAALGLLDDDFRQLIPNLSFKQKQITKSFYDVMDVFWGPTFSRANQTGSLNEPYSITTGDTLSLKVDGLPAQSITVVAGDLRIVGAATSEEIKRILDKLTGITTTVIEDPASTNKRLNIRTNTPGLRGSLEFLTGFDLIGIVENKKFRVTDLAQRTVLYQINSGEVLIELPAVVPTLRRTLKGSHHFHQDATLETPIIPGETPWQGSFIYSKNENPFGLTSIKTTLTQDILKGDVLSEVTVDDSSTFPASGGQLVFDFGKADQEEPVNYITTPNSNTILVDPGYSFQQNHLSGSSVNLLIKNETTPYEPRVDGSDYAIYLTSPANARSLVQDILKSLSAAGISVTFLILLPSYRYIIDNPYA